MERKLCNECQLENFCKYESYIKDATDRINNFSGQKEIKETMAIIDYLKFRAITKSDPCPVFNKPESTNISAVVLDENEGQNPEKSAEQTSS